MSVSDKRRRVATTLAKATADLLIDFKSHCQGNTNDNRRPKATTAGRATADSPIDCQPHYQGHVLGDKWQTSGDKSRVSLAGKQARRQT